MLKLVEPREQKFTNLSDFRDALAAQDRRLAEVPSRKLSLSKTGLLQVDGFEGRLADSGLLGLLSTLGIPHEFARQVCPQDLLVTIVNRLGHGQGRPVLVRLVDGVVTGVMPATRQPLGHDMLLDWIGDARPIREATLAGAQLRILAIDGPTQTLLPNDDFDLGWELVCGEDGWHATELGRLVIRQVCSNGMVGFDEIPVFRRTYNSNQPAMKSLADLQSILDRRAELPQLGTAISWAADKALGREYKAVVSYLAQQLEGNTTRVALAEIGTDSSWYDLLNTVTSLAKFHRLEIRRRYELQGGMLLKWFSQRGQTRPPWRRVVCKGCEAWDGYPGDANASRSTESARQLSLFD